MPKPFDATLKGMLEASPRDRAALAGHPAEDVRVIDADSDAASTFTGSGGQGVAMRSGDFSSPWISAATAPWSSGCRTSTLHRHAAAHAVADEVRLRDLEVIKQRGHIVGKILAADVAFDVRRAAMALHFDGNHFSRFGKLADPAVPVVGDGHKRAVEQHHGFAAAVDFVVHFEPVDRRVTRRWLLLRRDDSRQEQRQEKSCCLHVSLLA